jgi:acetylornithine deacetylase
MAASERVLKQVSATKIVELGSELIKRPSFKMEETPLARWLGEYFTSKGYEVDLQEVDPGRYQCIATLRGAGGGKTLMFNGHIDNDSITHGWKRDPWTPTVEGDRLYGNGIYNMKGGDTSMIMAAEAIRQAGVKLKGDLIIACVVGELQGGVGTVHMLKRGISADMAVVTEPKGSDNIVTTHGGITEMAITIVGNSRHISQMEHAVDALEKAVKAIPAIKAMKLRHTPNSKLPGLPRVNVGAIIGGRGPQYDLKAPYYTCDYCTFFVDVRMVPSMTSQTVEEDIRAVLDSQREKDPTFNYEIEHPPADSRDIFRVRMEPLDIPHDSEIVETLKRSYVQVTGHEPALVGTKLPAAYATDASHLANAGIPAIIYGPEGSDGTSEEADNYISISAMVKVTKVLALTALSVCGVAN